MFRMKDLDGLADQRVIAPVPLLSSPLDAARGFIRWWDAHRGWPGNEPAQIGATRLRKGR